MQGTERFEVTSFLGCGNEKKFFKVQCKESLQFFTMEVVSNGFIHGGPNLTVPQFGSFAESLPNWGMPFCMELRFVFDTPQKRFYILDFVGEANLADLMNDGLPEPTVLYIAAELGLALEGLHELGVSYNELDLGNVTVDNNGHVVLWREFEGKEYWHISECICGVHGVDCGKTAHEVKRRGMNVPPGQRHWEEIAQGVQDDWRRLGALLCQLLTGQVDFQNQSLEEAIISLFITPNTKDFLYGLVAGTVKSFEDVKCHPCFDGLDWEEVKSKSVQSPLMANFRRSRFNSTNSTRFSKSPSLQNVYTAGMSARQERGVFRQSSLSRTHSTSDLYSYSLGNARPGAFDKGRSDRRSTLCMPYSRGGENVPEKERFGMKRNEATNIQESGNFPSGNFRGYSRSVGAKSTLSLKRQVFEQRIFDRPPCLSAPTSPRNSLDNVQSYVYPHVSAPSCPQGSIETIHSRSDSSLHPATTAVAFNGPETNPFHEGYKKRWGSTTLDTAYGIYSSNLKLNNNSTIPGSSDELVSTNQVQINTPAYGNYSRDLNNNGYDTAPYRNDGPIDSTQTNTYGIANGFYSQVFTPDGHSTILHRSEHTPINSSQPTAYTTDMPQQRYNTRHYSIDVSPGNAGIYYNSRISPNNTSTIHPNFQPNDFPNNGSKQAEDTMSSQNNEHFQKRKGSIGLDSSGGMYSSFFQTSANNQNENMSTERRNSKETAGILFPQHFRSRRGSVGSENSGKVSPNSRTTDSNQTSTYADGTRQVPRKQTCSISREQSHFRQSNHEMRAECSRTHVTNNTILADQLPNDMQILQQGQSHVKQRSVEDYSVLKTIPNKEPNNDVHESVQPQGTAANYSRERMQERTVRNEMHPSSLQTTPNSLALPPSNTPFQKRNSRSPEAVVAVHPTSTLRVPSNNSNSDDMCVVLSDDVDEFNRFQEQSQRRRSSTDVASLSYPQAATSKSETPSRKMPLSRSVSYSNVSEGFRSARNDPAKPSAGQLNCRRSMALRPIPSFEEFRSMRALSKMAYGENGNVNQKDTNNNCMESNCMESTGNNNSSSSNNNNESNHHSSNSFTETPTGNPVIQDLLVKYGLDKSPRPGSTLKVYRDSSKPADTRDGNSPTPSAQASGLETTSSDQPDTKQRLLNILDDFLAVRMKHKTLSASSSMNNIKAVHSVSDQRRPSLPSTLIEEHQSSTPNYSTANIKVARDSPVKGFYPIDLECGDVKELTSHSSGCNETEKYTNPSLVISTPNSESIVERTKNMDRNSDDQSKVEKNLKKTGRKNYSESPRRRSKKSNTTKKNKSEVQQSETKVAPPRGQTPKVTLRESNSNADINQSDDCTSSEFKPKEREVSRRVSEHARKMALRRRESMELVKNTGRKAKNERRESFMQALQNEKKEISSSEKDHVISRENVPGDIQPVVKLNGPIKGDHSVEIEASTVEQRDTKYLRLIHRRTSSLLSLTDYLGRGDDFEQEDENRTESLSEFDLESEIFESNSVGHDNSFLSVKSDADFPRGRKASRTESSSSLLSRGSSFHSNFSADSGSVHLDFEDSDADDDLFYLDEPPETHEKSESEIQRNDSGLGDEIGVGTRVKKRWEDLGHVSARQSMIVASWRELASKSDGKFEDEQPKEEGRQEKQQEHGQQQQGRKVSRDRRISRDRQPNAIDCPDCGRAFLVEKDKPSVKSQGPNQTLICYKCQSHRVERKEAIIELVQTEINYGNDFEIIKEEFLSPMQTGGIVSPDNLAKIFLNIQELLDVSTKFCKKIEESIEECVSKNDEELCHMNVGRIFVENVELLQAYELYCSKQPDAISLLESLQKKNDVLRVFLNITCRENPKCRKMDINSFLLAPVQRVTKYPLLLSRIRRTTPRWHGDREDLKLAQRKVEEQIAKINSLTKSSETKTKKFQSNLGASDSVDSSRLKKLAADVLAWTLDEMQLLMHGQLKVLCSEFGGGQSWTKRTMKKSIETHLLFCIRGQNEPIRIDSEEDDCLQFPSSSEISDASLLLLKRKNNGKYTLFRDEIKLRDCVVYEETESDSFGLVHMGKETFQFTARASKDARKWMKYLKLQTICQGKWRRRRNASANIMLKTS